MVTEVTTKIDVVRMENDSLKDEVKNIFNKNVENFVENIVKVTKEIICSTQQQIHEPRTDQ